ncbi:hypothetical protein CERZMDRAFT_106018 [Cercospora zeae-maydis SCOH1-5]|uniref:Uncharacterized protein n=1 Tax=Cercospora zeae-maydis SCOH1-5 TaxID=717836 RepID=A0A6A6FGY1_9PEZI|nr:hypothetical protein CERZMDRAFT_106018 [Cercospora zeae-maydis SCOH1-5]
MPPFSKPGRPKLTKTRSIEHTAAAAGFDAHPASSPSGRSFSESKNGKLPMLPRSLTLPDDPDPATFSPPAHKHRLPKRASASALNMDSAKSASTTTVNSVDLKKATNDSGVQSPKIPVLTENMNKIDVEQAISLLQELKKSASPEELVSLHKALLPTKEVSSIQKPSLSSIDEHSAYSSYSDRPRSMRPPGLATRGSFLEDPLRSQEEEAKRTLKKKESKEQHGAWFQETMSAVHARTMSITSTGTAPDSSYDHGAFGLGTLRIINGGSASPDPTSRPNARSASVPAINPDPSLQGTKPGRRSEEAPMPAETRLLLQELPARRHSQNAIDSPTRSPLTQRRQQQWGLRTSQPIPSLASFMRTEAKLDGAEAKPAQQAGLGGTRADSGWTNDYRTLDGSTRFEQRWKQRKGHLPSDKPCEEAHELSASSIQPSTAGGAEPAEKIVGTPSQALLQLDPPVPDNAQITELSPTAVDDTNVTASPRFSFEELPRPRTVQKQDSGYGSDAPSASRKFLKGPVATKLSSPAPPKKLTVETQTKNAPDAVPPAVQAAAEALERPATPKGKAHNAAAMLHPPVSPTLTLKKKRLSPLSFFRSRNRAEKRNSVAESVSSAAAASPTQSASDSSSPSSSKGFPRTLQKKMPEQSANSKKSGPDKSRRSLNLPRQNGSSVAVNVPLPPMKQKHEVTSSPSLGNDAKQATESPKTFGINDGLEPAKPGTSLWARRRKSADPSVLIHELSGEQRSAASTAPLPVDTAERRRSKSLAGPGMPLCKRKGPEPTSYSSCMRGGGNNAKPKLPTAPEPQPFARAPDAVPQQHDPVSATASVPKTVRRASLRGKGGEMPAKPATSDATPSPPERPMSSRSHKSVEDIYSEWQSKPATVESSPAEMDAQMANARPPALPHKSARPHAIPPIPELPADIDAMLCKAELMMSKKTKTGPKMSPRASARNSLDAGRKRLQYQNAQSSLSEEEINRMLFSQTVVGDPLFAEAPGDTEMPVEADSKPVQPRRRHSEHAAKTVEEKPVTTAKGSSDDAQLRPLWEQYSTTWRLHNTIPESAAEDNMDGNGSESPKGTQSPSSSSIAPFKTEDTANSSSSDRKRRTTVHLTGRLSGEGDRGTGTTSNHVRRSSSIISSGTYTTSSSPMTSSSEASHRASTATASSYTSNNGSTASFAMSSDTTASSQSKYLPYRPVDSVHAERSRALNMARRSCQIKPWEIEKLKTSLSTPSSPKAVDRRPSLPKTGAAKEAIDRFSGGLSYNNNNKTFQAGNRGSAGTKSFHENGNNNNSKKGVKMSQEWGLDLNDVPSFLQRKK